MSPFAKEGLRSRKNDEWFSFDTAIAPEEVELASRHGGPLTTLAPEVLIPPDSSQDKSISKPTRQKVITPHVPVIGIMEMPMKIDFFSDAQPEDSTGPITSLMIVNSDYVKQQQPSVATQSALQHLRLSFHTSTTPFMLNKWSLRFGGTTYIQQKFGSSSAFVSLGYRVLPQSTLLAHFDLGDVRKVRLNKLTKLLCIFVMFLMVIFQSEIRARHTFSSIGCTLNASLSSTPSDPFVYANTSSIFSDTKRLCLSLQKNIKIRDIPLACSYSLNMKPNENLVESTEIIVASNSNSPFSANYTFRLLLGGASKLHPLMVTASQQITGFSTSKCKEHVSVSLGFGKSSAWLPASEGLCSCTLNLSRTLSDYSTLVMGISYSYYGSLSWIFQWTRGGMVIRIPIALTSAYSTNALIPMSLKAWYICLMNTIIHAFVGDLVTHIQSRRKPSRNKLDLGGLHSNKARLDALQQQLLMRKASLANRRREASKGNGLIIERAIYGIIDEDSLDVTTPLQFWVTDSNLSLPSGSKSHMLGFYQVVAKNDQPGDSSNGWWKSFASENLIKNQDHVRLKVIYSLGGTQHCVDIQDSEPLVIP